MSTSCLRRDAISVENFPENGSFRDKMKFVLGYALLAPSTHNIQPWLFKLNDDGCQLFLNHNLQLPQADPLGRDAFIALGFCWENLMVAAKYFGLYGEEIFDLGDINRDNHQLVATFKAGSQSGRRTEIKECLDAITKRSNVRGKFDSRQVDPGIIEDLRATGSQFDLQLDLITDQDKITDISFLTQRGMRLAHAQKEFRNEMSNWIINNLSSRCSGMPAYSMNIPTLPSLFAPTILKMFDCSAVMGKLNQMSVASAPLIAVVSSKENTAKYWFDTGRLAQRVIVKSVAVGLKHSIYLASIEMPPLPDEVKKVIGTNLIPQFIFCLGYMDRTVRLTQRHSVEDKLI